MQETEATERDASEEEKSEKSVSSDLIRGHINTIILRSLYDGDKYGYEIIAEIERKSHGQYSLKQPSLYSALKRLEKDGYVTSYWGGSVSGGRRKYFSLTEAGKLVSEQNQSEWEYSRTVIDSLISDKDFDFSNPAPTAVNMRVLRDTTSRVPRGEGEDDELDFEPAFDDSEDYKKLEEALAAERAKLNEATARFEEEVRSRNDALLRERDWREQEIAARERTLEEKRAALEALRAQLTIREHAEDAARIQETQAFETRIQTLTQELEEAKQALDEAKQELDTLNAREEARAQSESRSETALREQQELLETERRLYGERLEEAQKRSEDTLAEERRLHEEALAAAKQDAETQLLAERRLSDERVSEYKRIAEEQLAEERRRSDVALAAAQAQYENELKEQETRIRAEQEELFRQREKQLLHRNYLDLVNAPPPEEESHDYTYFTPPHAEEAPAPAAETEDYRSVVHRMYQNAVSQEAERPTEDRARPLDGIDFADLESRAAQDGITIRTAGGKMRHAADLSESIVHKGKALFLCGIVTFIFCVVLGSVVLGVQSSAGLPVFYPYFIWCVGLAVLLVTGLAYANHYGERALRRTGPVLLNTIVAYILLVIVTLIVALTARADLSLSSQLLTFVIIPVIFFFGVVLFGVTYYLQVRPKKD